MSKNASLCGWAGGGIYDPPVMHCRAGFWFDLHVCMSHTQIPTVPSKKKLQHFACQLVALRRKSVRSQRISGLRQFHPILDLKLVFKVTSVPGFMNKDVKNLYLALLESSSNHRLPFFLSKKVEIWRRLL
jgi:hypothetical protein